MISSIKGFPCLHSRRQNTKHETSAPEGPHFPPIARAHTTRLSSGCGIPTYFSPALFYQWAAKDNDRSTGFKPTEPISLYFLKVQFGKDALNVTYALLLHEAARPPAYPRLSGSNPIWLQKKTQLKCKTLYAQNASFTAICNGKEELPIVSKIGWLT